VRALGLFVPKPDLTLVLAGDAEVMRARKPEISESEVRRQVQVWTELHASRERALSIDTTRGTVDASVRQGLAAIQDARTDRLAASLRKVPFWPKRLEAHRTGSAAPVGVLYQPSRRLGRVRKKLGELSPLTARRTPWSEVAASAIASSSSEIESAGVIKSANRQRGVAVVTAEALQPTVIKFGLGPDGHSVGTEAETLTRLVVNGISVPEIRGPIARFGEDGTAMAMQYVAPAPSAECAESDLLGAVSALATANDGEGITHGDFRPWNVRWGKPTVVFDWEHAHPFVPGHDLATYLASAPEFATELNVERLLAEYARRVGVSLEHVVAGWNAVCAHEAPRMVRKV
jgi:hypothetical protein